MKLRILAVAASVFMLLHGIGLYDRGMYERAREVFAEMPSSPLTDGYSLLCDLQMKVDGYKDAVDRYDAKYGKSSLYSDIHFLAGQNLFDEQNYALAQSEFRKVSEKVLDKKSLPELYYKTAYSDYQLGRMEEAKEGLLKVEALSRSDYSAPARYAMGYILYSEKNFADASGWFEKAAKDTRFAETANYYILECRFMQKDYRYIAQNGEAVYETIPAERKPHLARILSESFLILGNTSKAKEYYDKNDLGGGQKTRSDYFYAGSLQYNLGNYQDAIENFSLMPMRTDSIGQIANYQLGYAYIQMKNKVSALDAFQQAAGLPYDAAIREDAFFNYAKLAFDLNHDAAPFTEYLNKYAKNKNSEQIYGYIALTSLYNRDYKAAVDAYDQIDELDPQMRSNYMKANYLRASQLIKNESYSDAIPYLRAATFFTDRQDNFNKLARYWMAESNYKTGNYAEAINIYTDLYNISALDRYAEGKAIPYNLAYAYLKTEDYASAARWFDNYIGSGTTACLEDAMTRRADCDFIRRDYQSAIQNYSRVVEKFNNVDNIYPYYQLGVTYGLSNKNNNKIEALSRVLGASRKAPYYSDALYELGRAYVLARNDSEAIRCFNLLKKNTGDRTFVAKALIELGMIARNDAKPDEAMSYYKQVVETMPGSTYAEDALLAIESIYQSKGRAAEYLDYIESLNIKKTEGEKESIYFNAAEQMYLAENYEKAIALLQQYVNQFPDGAKLAQAYFYLADSYKATGNKERACTYYSKVANMSDTGNFTELAMLNFANLSYGLERYSDAYGAYSSLLDAARIENNKFTAKQGMMRSAYRDRNYQNAIKAAETVRKDDKGSADDFREADFVKAMSYLATSQRDRAFSLLRTLSSEPSTDEGAQANYLLIQDTYDQGHFDEVESMVYKFSESAGGQNYWLAKAFIVLGDSFAEKQNYKQARTTFESILSGYEPQGEDDDVIDNVKMRLTRLEDYE